MEYTYFEIFYELLTSYLATIYLFDYQIIFWQK